MPSKGLVFFLHDGHQDTATLWASTHDTVLIFQSEKVKTALVKILVPPCIKGDPYYYLMNMHFFAGKFYLARDEKKLHPIIFTVCGEVHGAEYINPDFKGFSNYGVERGPIYESADRVHLYNEKDKSMWAVAAILDWRWRNDTLQISHELLIKER